ncbi:MAG TPA: hypothetical protein VHS99_11975 [Chloroflexota bacterium]|jgi:hypothetical protein|nr:hypothetical protein [Chloroflexota bacterium]
MPIVSGAFVDRVRAEEALGRLREAGFQDNEMGLVTRTEAEEDRTVEVPAPDDPRRGDSAVPVATFATIAGVVVGGAFFGPVGAIIGGLATGGGLGAVLSTRGYTEDEARAYERRLGAGHHVLTVNTGADADGTRTYAARTILRQHGADLIPESESR